MFFPVSGATKSTFPHVTMSNLDNLRRMFGGLLPDVDGFFRFWRGAQIGVRRRSRSSPRRSSVDGGACRPSRPIRRGKRMRCGRARDIQRLVRRGLCARPLVLRGLDLLDVARVRHAPRPRFIPSTTSNLARARCVGGCDGRRLLPHLPSTGVSCGSSALAHACSRDSCALPKSATFARVRRRSRCVRHRFPVHERDGGRLDRDAAKAAKAGHLLDVARERHFDRLAVFSYNPIDFSRAPAGDVLSFIEALQPTPDTRLSLEYALPDSRFAIFRFDPPQADRP